MSFQSVTSADSRTYRSTSMTATASPNRHRCHQFCLLTTTARSTPAMSSHSDTDRSVPRGDPPGPNSEHRPEVNTIAHWQLVSPWPKLSPRAVVPQSQAGRGTSCLYRHGDKVQALVGELPMADLEVIGIVSHVERYGVADLEGDFPTEVCLVLNSFFNSC
mgnify:CR=1 FL=1